MVTGLSIMHFSKRNDNFYRSLHVFCDSDVEIALLERDVSTARDDSGQHEADRSCVVTSRECKDRRKFPRYIYNAARLLFGVIFSFPYIQAFICKITKNVHIEYQGR